MAVVVTAERFFEPRAELINDTLTLPAEVLPDTRGFEGPQTGSEAYPSTARERWSSGGWASPAATERSTSAYVECDYRRCRVGPK